MGNNWNYIPFTEAVAVNPSVSLNRGKIYPFVEMKAVHEEGDAVRFLGLSLKRTGGSVGHAEEIVNGCCWGAPPCHGQGYRKGSICQQIRHRGLRIAEEMQGPGRSSVIQ